MNEPLQTRRCHRCHRHSWLVAQGDNCPWCGRKTGKHHYTIDTVVGVCAVLSVIAVVTYFVGCAV